jgi:CheY-like chemotaxis protein
MDINMPGINGYQASKIIRAMTTSFIVAVTSDPED